MNKQDTIAQFIDACYISIKCVMCGGGRSDFDLDDEDLAERIWQEGWRFQNGQVLCQHCTDGKR